MDVRVSRPSRCGFFSYSEELMTGVNLNPIGSVVSHKEFELSFIKLKLEMAMESGSKSKRLDAR